MPGDSVELAPHEVCYSEKRVIDDITLLLVTSFREENLINIPAMVMWVELYAN